jgi:hypothetical protein
VVLAVVSRVSGGAQQAVVQGAPARDLHVPHLIGAASLRNLGHAMLAVVWYAKPVCPLQAPHMAALEGSRCDHLTPVCPVLPLPLALCHSRLPTEPSPGRLAPVQVDLLRRMIALAQRCAHEPRPVMSWFCVLHQLGAQLAEYYPLTHPAQTLFPPKRSCLV